MVVEWPFFRVCLKTPVSTMVFWGRKFRTLDDRYWRYVEFDNRGRPGVGLLYDLIIATPENVEWERPAKTFQGRLAQQL